MGRLIEELRQDTRFGVRLLSRNPGFATVIILTLAVAIGANTAIFTVINALFFKPLPAVAAPHELARVKAGETQMAWPNYEEIRRDSSVFIHLTAQRTFVAGLATGDRPVRLMGQQTSDNFFVALGAHPAMGRIYTPAVTRRDEVVLADRIWRARFGSDPSLVGRVLTLGGRPFEVVGIMPPAFRGTSPPGRSADFWIAVDPSTAGRLQDRTDSAFEIVGRLKPGVTHEQAAAALQVMAGRLRAAHPEISEMFLRMSVFPVDGIRGFEGMARALLPVFAFLGVMTVVSGFVLLIACANIAGMLLGRASARRQEIAMRLALGAGRGRLVRQLLTESLVPAIMGGAAGGMLASVLAHGFNVVSASLPFGRDVDVQTDVRVLMYTLGLTIFTAVVFGLAPARRAARFDVISSLKDDGGSTARQNMRRILVAAQVAVSTALLLWSGLFVRSLGRINEVDPGFDPKGVLLASVTFDRESAQADPHVLTELQQRVRASGGVLSAGMASIVPLAMTGREEFDVSIADPAGGTSRRRIVANRLAPGWFETVRIDFVAGRDFTWSDREESPRVAIVNETLARQFWNGEALGKQILHNRRPVEVVGVVRDSKYWTLGETISPTLYLPFRQGQAHGMTLHVRTADPMAATGVILGELQRLAPGLPVEIEPMSQAVAAAIRPAQSGAAATGAFGILAILLSALGVYGLVSFVVVQRTREIGVRKALGAGTHDIILMLMGSTARLTGAGLAIGIATGMLGAVALRGFIFGVSPMDPVTVVAAIVVVTMAALAASGLPAIAASRVDPAVTLRNR